MGIQDEAARIEMLAGLQRALDNNFHRIRESARTQWETHFGRTDTSYACVTVRVGTTADAQPAGLVCAGLLPNPKPPRREKMRPRLA
jgi:hypothetical protein